MRIKEAARELDPKARVVLFGSFARGNPRPDSDIDILVITDAYGADAWRKAEMIVHISERVGGVGIFEIHVATTEECENWYMQFIDAYREV
ncbi:nucleotidyltransferase domain-containing protein [Pyrobaculum aerophilum]|uniref:nucleotidyltransferase domain-containing protein n=1 Tax=Pyrobaculum aerophilum TaxID=13773 RepID=UPI0021623AB4|nr:nucleotidyltransferase domain-containing protein [Pyrobaculum aerophilum]